MTPSTANVRPPCAAADRGERLQRGAHRLRVGVVGVVDHDGAVGALGQLHPPPAHRRRAARAGSPPRRAAGRTPGRRPRRRARCRPGARRRGAARRSPSRPAVTSRNRGRPRSSDVTLGGADVRGRRLAERDDPRGGAARHREHERVVGVEHRDPVGGQRLDEFALGLRDRLAAAELAEVRAADVEHRADARRRDVGQVADVADPPRALLQHQEPGLRRRAQHGVRMAELVVERARAARRSARPPRAGARAGPSSTSCRPSRSRRSRSRPAAAGSPPTRARPAPRAGRAISMRGPSTGRVTRLATAPARAAASVNSCPSTCSPSIATNNPPGPTWRESYSTLPVTTTSGSASRSAPPTMAATSPSVSSITSPPPAPRAARRGRRTGARRRRSPGRSRAPCPRRGRCRPARPRPPRR